MRFNMRPQPGRDMLMITAFGVYVTWCVRTINKAYNHEECQRMMCENTAVCVVLGIGVSLSVYAVLHLACVWLFRRRSRVDTGNA